MNKEFWKNKKVLITGNTGFKGSWLTQMLVNCNAEVFGYALENENPKSIHNVLNHQNIINECIGDICDTEKLIKFIDEVRPEIVFHLAAQPIVLHSYKFPVETYQTNVIGTATLFDCIKQVETVKAVINITTDKVYENCGMHKPFSEDDRLGGYDPYSASKACSEIVTSSFVYSFFNKENYGKTHNTAVATARAGNVIGGGDYAPNRLIPDCIRAIEKHDTITLRNPEYIRPWQNVLEPLSLYITLAEKLYKNGTEYNGAWNIGPEISDCISVIKVLELFKKHVPELKFQICEDVSGKVHEAELLMLNSEKIKNKLEFKNHWNIDEAVKYTALWYKAQLQNENMTEVTNNIIEKYFNGGK